MIPDLLLNRLHSFVFNSNGYIPDLRISYIPYRYLIYKNTFSENYSFMIPFKISNEKFLSTLSPDELHIRESPLSGLHYAS